MTFSLDNLGFTDTISSMQDGTKRYRDGFLPSHLPDTALARAVQSLLRKGAFELAPLSSLGYYSH